MTYGKKTTHRGEGGHASGWEVLNIQPGNHVDHVGDTSNLSQFPDNTFAEIHASHILEHLYIGELQSSLKEWNRVLKEDGLVYISVPDMDVLCKLLLDKENLDVGKRFSG